MNIGDVVSSLTGGFWVGFATTSTGVSIIPKTNTLMLSKLVTSIGTSGGQVQTWTDVQSLGGSLQPTNAQERLEWSKETKTADYKFFFGSSEFTSDDNSGELKESSKLTQTMPVKTFDIVGISDRSSDGGYYLVFLQEKK